MDSSSLLVDPPWRYVLLYAGIAIEILAPVYSRSVLKTIPVSSHHMPERFGLLTIILFGESVVAIAAKLSDQTWSALIPFAAINGFVVTCAAWWLYFNTHEELVGKVSGTGQRVLYGYLGIYCGLSVLSAAIGFSISGGLNTIDHIVMIGIGLVMFTGSMYFTYGMAVFVNRAQRISVFVLIAGSGLMLGSGHLQS
jgi:low temperature requirement protein LtrA